MPRVLLLREPAHDWRQLHRSSRYSPLFLPVLQFRPAAQVELRQRLLAAQHAGLLLTSPRAAEACLAACPDGLPAWQDKPVFVVGTATSDIVTRQLLLPTRGSESGNADNLADYIISNRETFVNDKPLLFPCGNLKKDTLPTRLKEAGILLDCLTVYLTSTKETLDSEIAQLKNDGGIPNTIVFFSPSGVDSVVPILNDIGYDYDNSNLISIGPSTEKQIRKWNLTPAGTASAPTVEGIVKILENIPNCT